MSTIYPKLQPQDPSRFSLAYVPLDMVLLILDKPWENPQIIPVEIIGPITTTFPKERDMESVVNRAIKVILRPPPLTTAASACKLFRFTYQKSRPTLWGDHLHLRRSHHVDLQRDIFHVRIRRRVHPFEWDRPGLIHWDPLYNALGGVERVATSVNYIHRDFNQWGANLLRHMNWNFKELMVLVPTPDLENNNIWKWRNILWYLNAAGKKPLLVDSLLMPMEESWWIREPPSFSGDLDRSRRFRDIKKHVEKQLLFPINAFSAWANTLDEDQRRYLKTTWRLADQPAVKGYLVPEETLNDPDAFKLGARFR
jgi:hypothetical protein